MKTDKKIVINFYHATGKLVLAENFTKIDFGIYNNSKITFNSVTEFLNNVYQSHSPFISFTIKRLDLDTPHWVTRTGKLRKDFDDDKIQDWFVEFFPLGKQLHELGEEIIEMKIEHLEVNEATEASDVNERQEFFA